jgi:hypothetical protein
VFVTVAESVKVAWATSSAAGEGAMETLDGATSFVTVTSKPQPFPLCVQTHLD